MVFEGESLTYRRARTRGPNRLARHLRRLGVGPEVLVGICAERSLEMVVGLLAILKAGGAYVPLDPVAAGRAAGATCWRTPAGRAGQELARLPEIRPERRLAARSRGRGTCPVAGRLPGQPGLRDLHLGLDRAAEGGRGLPPRAGQPAAPVRPGG